MYIFYILLADVEPFFFMEMLLINNNNYYYYIKKQLRTRKYK